MQLIVHGQQAGRHWVQQVEQQARSINFPYRCRNSFDWHSWTQAVSVHLTRSTLGGFEPVSRSFFVERLKMAALCRSTEKFVTAHNNWS
jgi:hypothetical protein